MKLTFPPVDLPRFTPLQAATHLASWVPLLALWIDYRSDQLTINPIQAATQRLGDTALVWLLATLAITPLITLTGYAPLSRLRRPLGLYAFFYALLHFYLYAGLDFQFDLSLLSGELAEKRYLWFGLPALLILLILAATSFKKMMRWMGKNWKRLHRLVYAAGALVLVHVALAVKGNLLELSWDIWKPLAAGVALCLLFLLRVPPLRRVILRWRRAGLERLRNSLRRAQPRSLL
jgi:sulfoxide reductase heme-binding subunit YedZ